MRLIFIRHAEPDYENNTLTERGFEEARILSERVPLWDVEQFYVSPLRRAFLTALPSLEKMNRTALTLDWMREFSYGVTDPTTGSWQIPWDFMPQYWTGEELLLDRDDYWRHPVLQSAPQYGPAVHALRTGLDALLAEYGYHRTEHWYRTDETITDGDGERTLVIFGHLGANFEAVGYLLGISPLVLKQTVYLAPTSVCILNAEKRQPGIAMFRAQALGDVSHLLKAGQPVSESGSFAPVLSL